MSILNFDLNIHRIWLCFVSDNIQVYLGCTYLSCCSLDTYEYLEIQKK